MGKMMQPGWARILIPFEAALTEEQVRLSTTAACTNAIRVGTTFLSEHGGHFPNTIGEAMTKVGIRGLVTNSTCDMNATRLPLPANMVVSTEEALRRNLEVVLGWSGLVTGCFSLRQITVCTPELIQRTITLAREHNRPVQTHANEGHYEIEFALREHGTRPIVYLAGIGGLAPGVIAAHSVLMAEEEVEAFAAHGVGVACCPRGNFGGLGRGQLPLMRRLDVPLGIGSDGAGGGSIDLFEAMRMASTCLDLEFGTFCDRRGVFSPYELLQMATIGGARVVGQEDRIGSLEVGKYADLVVLRPDIGSLPVNDPITTVVQSCSGRNVVQVFVSGQQVMKNGVITTIDEAALRQEVVEQAPRIQERFLENLR
jgi:5-methylthioadenosine/S-adenosylhomocysteine deaminase